MYKVIIADDEPKIRNGLAQNIDWGTLGLELSGIAKDGEEALDMIMRLKPDICLLDIRMPFYDGLVIATKVKSDRPETVIIFITGHDEFEYAQNALKLKAYDFILKPVNLSELNRVLEKAKKELEDYRERESNYHLANLMLQKNLPTIRNTFLNHWLRGEIQKDEIEQGLSFYKLELAGNTGLILVNTHSGILTEKTNQEKDRQILLFAIQNITDESIQKLAPCTSFRDWDDNIVVFASITDFSLWDGAKTLIENNIKQYLDYKVTVYQCKADGNNAVEGVTQAYMSILQQMQSESEYLPIVKRLKGFIDQNYQNPQLRLQDFADQAQMSIGYLSKLFKQETGTSFVEYATRLRLNHSLILMQDPSLKIYEIAERAGYNSQHYFCDAFKKTFGISPTEFRRGMQ